MPKALREAMAHPEHLEAVLEAPNRLVLQTCLRMTVQEAALRFGRHGITQEVLVEALRLVQARQPEGPGEPLDDIPIA